ncbi:MAG: DNA polymerase III subunit gamma/tau [Methylacidiphilales bacterium]|nr:DNA polymerase III subunit gamma/tau [Candidatus Methylacidiphilales bacterium]
MSYQVLARKYRPRTFAEIIGQEHVVKTLSNAIATGRIAHAFLFVGPRGIGKTSTARILAMALNCKGGPKADFDPDDDLCREISEGRSMDVLEIDGASNNGVEQVRELRDNVQYAPARGKFKIYIIDEVHMLSAAAFNALLKTLEEPPAHVKFIFATTEPHKVLSTILSRCQRFDLKRISDKDIVKQLKLIAEKEKIKISDAALRLLARNAEGGMRDAESAFDQLISFCGSSIEEKDVLEIFGLTGPQEIWELAEAVQSGEDEVALQKLRALVERGKDLSRLSQQLLRYFRNLLVYVISPEISQEELEPDEARHFANLKPLPARDLILALIDELVRLEEKIRYALVKEVLFEITLIRMTRQRQRVSIEEILGYLARGGPAPSLSAPAADSSAPATPVKPVPTAALRAATPTPALASKPAAIPEPRSAPAVPNGATPEELWSRAIEPIKKKELVLRRALDFCEFKGLEGGRLKVKLVASKAMLEAIQNSQQLKDALAKAFGPDAGLDIDFSERAPDTQAVEAPPVPAGTESPAKPTSASASAAGVKTLSKAEFENDPLIQEALKAFDARIVAIKQD